jgi:hypothetical protein
MSKQGHLGKIQFTDNEEIKLVAKLFPYSLPLQALASKNLKDNNKLDHDKFLRLSSVISPDRNWLYNYVNHPDQKPLQIAKTADFKVIKIEQNNSVLLPIQPEEKESEAVEFSINIEPETVLINDYQYPNDLQDDLIISESLKTSMVETVLAEKEEDKIKEIPFKFTDNQLEKEILKVAIDKSIQQEVSEISVYDDKPVERNEDINKDTEPEGFNFWLNPASIKLQSREEKLKKIDALIEKFIKSEPKISPKKVEFYSPVNVAKQSVEFDEDLVSEPLASIFEKQGYFDKAIKAYEKLSLKYPEKRAYFATRIEKIHEIIKNIKNNK